MAVTNQCRAMPRKVIKDPIHEYVDLPEDFVDTAVDRRIFQRLRWIAQLSMNFHVYPGANHTRFEHSLGVAYVMLRALRYLRENIEIYVSRALEKEKSTAQGRERQVVDILLRLLERVRVKLYELEKEAVTAALYHDIGHIMLSHSAESGIRDVLLRRDPFNRKMPQVWEVDHEIVTLNVVKSLAEAYRLWEEEKSKTIQGAGEANPYSIYYNCERVDLDTVYTILGVAYKKGERRKYCGPLRLRVNGNGEARTRPSLEDFLEGGLEREAKRMVICIIASLLSSNVDVDRADYILRDSHHSGSKAGVYDINRYYSVLTLVPIVNRISRDEYEVRLRLGVLDKGVATVENILLSRIYLYRDLYLHDISMIYGSMAARLFSLLLYTARIIESTPREEASQVFERFPLLEALARFPFEATASHDFERLQSLLDRLTDHEFYSLAKRLSGPDFSLFSRVVRRAAAEDGLEDSVVDEVLLAVGLLAKGITGRRHWTGLLLTGDPATRIIGMLLDEDNGLSKEMMSYITPLVMLDHATYVAYKRGTPDDDTKEIYIFYRSRPLEPTDITRSPLRTVVDKIADTAYSKIIITYPPGAEPPDADKVPVRLWTVRRGKPRYHRSHTGDPARPGRESPRDYIEPVASMAGISWDRARDLLRGAAEKAWALARLLESRALPG